MIAKYLDKFEINATTKDPEKITKEGKVTKK